MKPLLSSFPCRLVAGGIGLTLCALGLGACTGEEAPPDHSAMLRDDEKVSSVPWNKQQGWENNSQLGPIANNPRFGGSSQ